jgi:hypothetical protein
MGLSLARWGMEAYPKKVWQGQSEAQPSREVCPDGMGHQIRLVAESLKGTPEAAQRLLHSMRHSHQSSTYLVGVLGAPLALLGCSPPVAFVILSLFASAALVWVLIRLARDSLAEAWGWQVLAVLLFLSHPASSRCLARPQTDALLAFFALASIYFTRRALSLGSSRAWWLLALVQFGGCLVKIHAVALLSVPVVVAWFEGARGRRLLRALILGGVVPLLLWLALFAALDLFGSICHAWEYKSTSFYQDWDLPRTLKAILVASGCLIGGALLHPKPTRGLPASLLFVSLGYVAILWISSIPPLARFQYPAMAPLALLCALALKERSAGAGWGRWLALSFVSVQTALTLALVGTQVYLRYFGPVRDLGFLARFLYDFL